MDAADLCPHCGRGASLAEGIHDFLGPDGRTREERAVSEFYTARPFPGYAAADDARTLLDRSRASPFLRALDEAIATDARVLDCGAGTGQLAAFLALAAPRREVLAADACRASLLMAARFKERAHIENLGLVRADLFALPFDKESFDIVVSRGVVHHTPDPGRAIASVASHVRAGGYLVLGFYETAARGVHRARRALSRLTGGPVRIFDPLLRRADLDPEKKQNWIADQYHHPLERSLSFPRVLRQLELLGFEWVRSVPPSPEKDGFFSSAPRPSMAGMCVRRAGWFLAGFADEDAGLVALVVRRHTRS